MKLRHVRDKQGRGAVTIASSEAGHDKLAFGFAFCSPKDNFSRKKGDEIATDRIVRTPLVIKVRGNKRETEKFIMRLLTHRDFDRLYRASIVVPSGFPNQVPGWLSKWAMDLQNKGLLCLKAVKI